MDMDNMEIKAGDYDDCAWAVKPDAIPEDQIAETIETEVLIIGGGISGLGAGARCTEHCSKRDSRIN